LVNGALSARIPGTLSFSLLPNKMAKKERKAKKIGAMQPSRTASTVENKVN
jgi:hypothetical protein